MTGRRSPSCSCARAKTHKRMLLAAVFAICLVVGWSAHRPAQGAPGPAKPDASKAGPGKLVEKWLGKQMLQELADACDKGKYDELAKRVDTLILERLACGHVDQLEALTDMVFVRRACKYLPMADKIDDTKKLSAWLVRNHDVSRLLFRALSEVQKPEPALEKFLGLWKKDEKRVAAYGNLSVAFATTTSVSHHYKQPHPTSYLQSFDWYTDNPKVPFRIDLKAAPYEISRYLTDTNLSLDERNWAVQHYGGKRILAQSYYDVRYDYDYLKGEPKKISKLEFTLQNLADPKVGGVCIERAYFAGEICKALGEPATIVCGLGTRGSHAWLACLMLKRAGQGWQAVWDSQTARFPYDSYFVGNLCDPATGKDIQDCELMLVGAAAQLPLERKEQADAACELAQFATSQVKNKAKVTELVELTKLADAYTKRVDATDKNAPKADIKDWSVAHEIDTSLVESLLNQAIEANLAQHRAWDLVIAMQKAQEISAQTTGKFIDILITRTGKEYPDYSANMVAQIVPTLQEPAAREKVYRKAIAFYGARPDLQGQLSVALADDLYEQGKQDEALKIYGQVAAGNMKYAQIVMDASAHAESRLTKDNKTALAIKMYTQLFGMLKKPHEDWDYYDSTYYQLGNRLVAVLKQDGQQEAATKLLEKIEVKDKESKK